MTLKEEGGFLGNDLTRDNNVVTEVLNSGPDLLQALFVVLEVDVTVNDKNWHAITCRNYSKIGDWRSAVAAAAAAAAARAQPFFVALIELF
mmetsp:Transcript_87836/g.175722  ORF Transcript_87836/g.175722 Transcript_87836/m.175722 type:complete len:91 (+) Transcript_87836:257-529(+)